MRLEGSAPRTYPVKGNDSWARRSRRRCSQPLRLPLPRSRPPNCGWPQLGTAHERVDLPDQPVLSPRWPAGAARLPGTQLSGVRPSAEPGGVPSQHRPDARRHRHHRVDRPLLGAAQPLHGQSRPPRARAGSVASHLGEVYQNLEVWGFTVTTRSASLLPCARITSTTPRAGWTTTSSAFTSA